MRMQSLLIGAMVFTTGCGGNGPYELAPVSGVVMLDGEPLANAHVSFQPVRAANAEDAGPGSFGRTDTEGRFTLETIDGARGAVVGRHSVRVTTAQDVSEDAPDADVAVPKETIPDRYNVRTALEVEVPRGGKDDMKLDLTSN